MPLPVCLSLMFLVFIITFAFAYKQGEKHYKFYSFGKPIKLKNVLFYSLGKPIKLGDILEIFSYGHFGGLLDTNKGFSMELTTLCCTARKDNFLCLVEDWDEKIYYLLLDKNPGEKFHLDIEIPKNGFYEPTLYRAKIRPLLNTNLEPKTKEKLS